MFLLVKIAVRSRIGEARAFGFVLHPFSAGKNRNFQKNSAGNIKEMDKSMLMCIRKLENKVLLKCVQKLTFWAGVGGKESVQVY